MEKNKQTGKQGKGQHPTFEAHMAAQDQGSNNYTKFRKKKIFNIGAVWIQEFPTFIYSELIKTESR